MTPAAMISTTTGRQRHRRAGPLAALLAVALLAASCSSDTETVDTAATEDTDTSTESGDTTDTDSDSGSDTDTDTDTDTDSDTDSGSDTDSSTDGTGESASVDVASGCEEIAALFGTDGSANPDLVDPESSAVCDGDMVVISSNAIPDYTYIETSPGPPRAQDLTYTIPAEPTEAAETTAVPLLGELGVTLAGIPIFGPTEGTGGDVGSLPGILMECGGHNGPSGFHLHVVGTSTTTDCDFSAEELASGPQLLGYAFDGYPIYTGNAQYTPSWELTDESLFATDTWAAHSYVEGSGDLDECNGRTDENGNYAYYTTDAFPYIIGCFVGEVELVGPGGRGPGDDEGAARPAREDDGERPARPEDEERPEREDE